jgi:hypothetical protein
MKKRKTQKKTRKSKVMKKKTNRNKAKICAVDNKVEYEK